MRRLVTPKARDSTIAEFRRMKDTEGLQTSRIYFHGSSQSISRYSGQVSKVYTPNEATQRMTLVAPRCYYIRPSHFLSSLCRPLQFLGAQAVCVLCSEYPAISGNSAPPKLPAADQFRVIFGGAPLCDSSNNYHQRSRGQVKQVHFLPRDGPNLFTSGFPFCSLTRERAIDRLRPSWPPSTSPRRSWTSSRDGGRSRLSRPK